ncbi:MAG: 1-acyl-sn-glycerol-3-phosphate acyltransferase [Verrucomicrobiota bacterium]
MIRPDRLPLFDRWVRFCLRPAFAVAFHDFRVSGREHLEAMDSGGSFMFCPNHSNWWDGFVAARIMDAVVPPRRFFLMQEEKHLRDHLWFRHLGIFGIDLEKPLAGMRQALRCLDDPEALLCIFPQGILLRMGETIQCREGVPWLVRKSGVSVLPAAFFYEWQNRARPTIFVRLGPAIPAAEVTSGLLEERLNSLFTEGLAMVSEGGGKGFQPISRWRRKPW